MKLCLLIGFSILNLSLYAQDSTQNNVQPPLFSISGYAEAYYSYDFNKPVSNTKPGFLYSYNRHNEFNVNLAYLKGSYNGERVRANLALAAGTYMNANYSAEPGVLKNLFEANAGFKITRNQNLWLDIGVLPSHIGFESAIGKDCWTLTRSMVADNSPYFEGGAKLSYGTKDGKLIIAAFALNGWQRITRVEGNSMMSWGSQVYYKASDKLTLNYSTFFGTDKPDSARLIRDYHNIYGIVQFNSQFGLTAGFDIGMEDKAVNNKENNVWYSPVAIIRFTPNSQWAVALRGEYFNDENEVIVATGSPNGFQTTGISLNIDFIPISNAAIRTEVRNLSSKDEIFTDSNGNTTRSNTSITISIAVGF